MSDGQGNDLPRAYVVIDETSPIKVSEIEIHEFLNPKVSVYKRLRGGVEFVDEVPRNLNGKIMRNVLKEWTEKGSPKQIRPKL